MENDSTEFVSALEQLSAAKPLAGEQVFALFPKSRLLIHLLEDPGAGTSPTTTLRLYLHRNDSRIAAYAFTSVTELEAWCREQKRPEFSVELFGGDLGLALPKDTWVYLDPSSGHATELSPGFLTATTSGAAALAPGDMPKMMRAPQFIMGGEVETTPTGPTMYQPVMVPTATKEEEQAKPKPFRARSNPTQLFTAPSIARKQEVDDDSRSRPRTYTSSNLKKIIRPPGSDE